MTVWLAGSRSATAARMATVLPATAQVMRAAASPQSRWRCSREGGRSRPNGMRASPNLVTTASITGVLLFLLLLLLLLLLVRGRRGRRRAAAGPGRGPRRGR